MPEDLSDALNKIATQIAQRLHVIYLPKWERLMVYQKGIYVETDEELIRAKVRGALRAKGINQTARNVNEVMSCIRDTYSHSPTEFDADERYVNFSNGVYDRLKDTILEHNPEHLSVRQVKTPFIKSAECPYIRSLFEQWVGPERAERLAEVIAWVLDGTYDIEGFNYLLGRGSNGKTTFLSIVMEIFGAENFSTVSMKAINTDKFAASEMWGKLANLSGETSGVIEDSSRVLAITGDDPVQWERKFGHPWTDKNRAKQIYAGMSVPSVKNGIVSDGLGRRFLPIFFPNRFDGSVAKSEILARARKEYAGLISWAMRLLPGLKKRNHFSGDLSIDNKVELYRLLSDGVYLFSKHFTPDFNSYITKQSLFQAYLDMCREYRFVAVGEYQFYRTIQRELGVVDAQLPPGVYHAEGRVRAFKGIRYIAPLTQLTQLSISLIKKSKEWNGSSIVDEVEQVEHDVRSHVLKLVSAGKMTAGGMP